MSSVASTRAFVQRILRPDSAANEGDDDRPVDAVLPPLTSSNEIDLELYAFIAILIKEYIQPWYHKITPDHGFIDEVVQIIAHCTRALEQRARNIDVEHLLLEEVPSLLHAHIIAFRTAQQVAGATSSQTSIGAIYHTLRPHQALEPYAASGDEPKIKEQEENYRTYRHLLSQGVLAILLPTDDLQNPTLYALVSEVFADLILGNFYGGRICESGFIYDSITRGCEAVCDRNGIIPWAFDATKKKKAEATAKSRLAQFGLLAADLDSAKAKEERQRKSALDTMMLILQTGFTVMAVAWALLAALWTSSQLPSRRQEASAEADAAEEQTTSKSMIPMVSYSIWTTAASLCDVSGRMPWLNGIAAFAVQGLLNGPGKLGSADSGLDRLLSQTLRAPIRADPSLIPTVLRTLRAALFPGNALPPPPPTTVVGASSSSVAESRRAAAFAILNTLPPAIARIYFGASSSSSLSKTAEDELESMLASLDAALLAPFEDAYANRHLAFVLLERIVAGLLPELARPGFVTDGESHAAAKAKAKAKGWSVAEALAERGVFGVFEHEDL